MEISIEQLQQIVKNYHPQAQLLKYWKLVGGISAQTIALEIALNDTTQNIVMRVHGDKDRARNPKIAQDEYKLLDILHSAGLPVPKPYIVDSNNQILPTSYMVIGYIMGTTEFSSDISLSKLHKLVNNLTRIHQIDLTSHDLSFLPQQPDGLERYLQQDALTNNRIYDALKHAYPYTKMNKSTLLHGDYWLGNILWNEDEIVGIIDWEDAMLGDPLSDLGKSRLELTWVSGHNMAEKYTQLYQTQMPHTNMSHLAFWDLWGAVRLSDFANWFDDIAKVNKMQNLCDEFVEQAIQKLQMMEE
jgi:aminoglycoside phosphotransferase (APT) family kinase protein